MVNERIQGLAEIYVQRMLISSLNQAPAILNSSIFNKTSQNLFIPEHFTLCLAHMRSEGKKTSSTTTAPLRILRQFFLSLHFPMYTPPLDLSLSLRRSRCETMNLNQFLPLSLTHSLVCLTPPFHAILLCGKEFFMYFFFDECVCIIWNMCIEWDERRKRRKNVELRTWKTRRRKVYTRRGDQGNMERAWNFFHRIWVFFSCAPPKWLKFNKISINFVLEVAGQQTYIFTCKILLTSYYCDCHSLPSSME